MGQLIEVRAVPVGRVALFDLDRSISGQDGHRFSSPPDGSSPPALLARRLWGLDDMIASVHVLSNTVSVERRVGWDVEALSRASEVIANLFIHYSDDARALDVDALREAQYNATISHIRAHNPELWVMRVTPDEPVERFRPGQYTTLALGFWEEGSTDDLATDREKAEKMARRSYSVSSSLVDEDGRPLELRTDEIEFYIVRVRPGQTETPALTPRLFEKTVGDRIYMGRKFTGRYTLDGVKPSDDVVFLATGTGEAPHNLMSAELLGDGHDGQILSVACVRLGADLAYLEQHEIAEESFPNYRYRSLTTREPENEGDKFYIQDYLESGQLEEDLGKRLDPETTHVFLCGNPAMIGLPRWDEDGSMTFPEERGVCQLLHERGFTIDHGRDKGNVHYEEYWTER